MATRELVPLSSTAGRWILAAAVATSSAELLSGLTLNVALPAIGESLDADISGLQWLANGYLLTLAALTLIGGSLGDRLGRRKVLLIGLVWFAVATVAASLSPNLEFLIVMRVLQGVGGALLTPASLAIIEATIDPEDRPRAIGAWSGLSGIAVALGPAIAGGLVDGVGWKATLLMPIPLIAVVAYVALRHLPETRDETAQGAIDVPGGILTVLWLGGLTFALIQSAEAGWGSAPVLGALVVAGAALVAFVQVERRAEAPMIPVDIFANAQLLIANLVTFVLYTSVGVVFFLVFIQLQATVGYSAFAAGVALLPVMAFMILFGARFGQLAHERGPRMQLLVGPIVFALGQFLLVGLDETSSYWIGVLPAALLMGAGIAAFVPPITAWALAAASDDHAGIASGVNNAVAGVAELISVAALPLIAGIGGAAIAEVGLGFDRAMIVSGVLALVAGAMGWLLVDNTILDGEPHRVADTEWRHLKSAAHRFRHR